VTETPEEEKEQAEQLFPGFIDELDEVNEKLETVNDWYDSGTPLEQQKIQQEIKSAEALYRMATNVLENTGYELDPGEGEILSETEQQLEEISEYFETDFEEVNYG